MSDYDYYIKYYIATENHKNVKEKHFQKYFYKIN